MKKSILCLVMAAVMTVGTSIGVCAEPSTIKQVVEFDGKKMTGLDSEQIAQSQSNLLPGDSMELAVDIKNSSDTETDWYMRNEIIKTLEEVSGKGGAYGYYLTYVSHKDKKDTETVIFDSDVVGGEGSQEGGVGLKQATNALDSEDYLYLERLKPGETGTVHLTVKLDGETQGNDYQGTDAELALQFAVEKVEAKVKYQPGETVKKTEIRTGTTTPKTGDPTKVIAVSALALVSGLVLLYFGITSVKKKDKDKKGEQ